MTERAIEAHRAARTALRIVGAYAALASLWVLLSGPALESMFSEPAETLVAGVFEGWLFVAVTSVLLYRLVSRLLEQLVAAGRRERRLHAEKLRALRLIETLAEHSDDAIFAQDLRGRYLLFNPAASTFFGRAAQDVLGRDHRALFPREDAAALDAAGRDVIERDRKVCVERTLPTPAGARRFRVTKAPLHDDAGRVVGLFGVARELGPRADADGPVAADRPAGAPADRATSAPAASARGGADAADLASLRRMINVLSHRLGEAPPYPVDTVAPHEDPADTRAVR